MKVEISPRQYSIRVYDKHDTNYIASAQILRYGDRALIYSITGKDGYRALPQILDTIYADGMTRMEGYVSPAHYRLLRMGLRGNTDYTIGDDGYGDMVGRKMIWVVIKHA